MSKREDLTGQRFNRWIVINFLEIRKKVPYWRCICDCGTEKDVSAFNLKQGTSTSCGCLKSEKLGNQARKHGLTNSPEHIIWKNMNQRCTNPKRPDYKHYGGRGICICDEWCGENGFQNFIRDMGFKPEENSSLDRIDNNGNYNKDNCRWVTQIEQKRNRSICKIQNMEQANQIREEYKNGIKTKDLALKYNCSKSCINRVLNNTTWN